MLFRLKIVALLLLGGLGSGEPTKNFQSSDIGLTIIGAIISPSPADHENNVLLLKNNDTKEVKALKEGHTFKDKYQILRIVSRDHFIVSFSENNDKIEANVYRDGFTSNKSVVQKPQVTPGTNFGMQDAYSEDGFARAKNEIAVTAAYRDKLIEQELGAILMQASAEPVFADGAIIGFLVEQIDPTSIYAKAGLVDGDIVTSINDVPLDNVTAAIKLLQSLKKATSVNFEVKRNGATLPMNVKVN